MTIMAAACGILIVCLGLLNSGGNATEMQSATSITCFVGGLILCFLGVILSRLSALSRRMDDFEAVAEEPGVAPPPDPADEEGR